MATILHQRVKALCKENHISFAILQTKLRFPKSTISTWRSSYPACDRVLAVAQYFNVSVDYLLGNTNNPAVQPNYCESTLELIKIADKIQLDHDTTEIAMEMLELLKRVSK